MDTRFPAALAMVIALTASLAGCGGDDPPAISEAPQQPSAFSQCNAFLGRSFEGATVTLASFVPTAANVPEYCLVRGEMPQDLDFEVRLPTAWNRRTVFMGGGGFDGIIRTPTYAGASPGLDTNGYATIATNHGHNSNVTPGATFALDVEMLAEYGNLAVPRVLSPAKAIIRARYGDAVTGTKMVYEGCSGGGRQGLIQAQRYPDLFDGVISRAPANAFAPQFLYYQKLAKQLAQPGAALTVGKIKAISDAVMAKCDALDGVNDNIISRPQACSFDPIELACTGAETDSCLTPTQVKSARTYYAATDVANGRYTWPAFPVGGEAAGWGNGTTGVGAVLGEGYIKYMIAQNPSVDWLNLDPSQYTSRIDQVISIIDAVDPDLGRFKARGGKLILWTGLTDWLITANNATGYYQSVVQKAGGQAAGDEFVEYYTAPGVQHCNGGTGADMVDLVSPMFDWLEKGTKPSAGTIIATQRTVAAGATAATRPLCKYPQYPRYVGGSPSAAASFVCSAP